MTVYNPPIIGVRHRAVRNPQSVALPVPALVQQAVASSFGGVTSQPISLPGVTPGHALILYFMWQPAGSTASVMSVSGGGSWVQLAGSNNVFASSPPTSDYLYYCQSSTGGAVTVTISGTVAVQASGGGAWLSEWTGLAAPDVTGVAPTTSTGTAMSSPTVTTTQPGDLVIMTGAGGGLPSASPGAPWTNVAGPQWYGANQMPIAYQVAPSAGGYSCAWTIPSGTWASLGAAILA